jgi:hypothetical protein
MRSDQESGKVEGQFVPISLSSYVFLCYPHHREMTYAINIGGARLVIGLDHQRFLNNVEIIKPRRQVALLEAPTVPQLLNDIGIRFKRMPEKHTAVDVQVKAAMTKELTGIIAAIGGEREGQWIRLSIDTWVKIADTELIGFFVKLS